MPVSLPDPTTARRRPVDVTRRALIRFFVPVLPMSAACAASPVRFTALADADASLWWLRCYRASQQLRPA